MRIYRAGARSQWPGLLRGGRGEQSRPRIGGVGMLEGGEPTKKTLELQDRSTTSIFFLTFHLCSNRLFLPPQPAAAVNLSISPPQKKQLVKKAFSKKGTGFGGVYSRSEVYWLRKWSVRKQIFFGGGNIHSILPLISSTRVKKKKTFPETLENPCWSIYSNLWSIFSDALD